MSFLKKVKQKEFWVNTLKISVPFFVFVTIISLLINSFSDIFSGNLINIAETNFNNGKWIQFWVYKIILSLFYGMYMTDKNMK
ncbi:hypothetical protein KO506_05760 [Polaribacter vadi]|uniref:hypothetical protein n=1 Tax=Polaribacter TaxID=52959 RepID=UPI001C084D3C|nr:MULTISPECIES: hypothetical protein [Polaribacter]MBU3010898.1 hypothetical protein [Polaribacter vadi]MDO6740710.1 hypothetical protein [Polaribacter sp. 1_MG-2023]